ncbi:MAG: L-threonylcarbamoyladenylate synthase [Halothiobacillus sp.]
MTTAFQLRQARDTIHAGGVVAYPTEAVFGLGCDPENEYAVQKILALKQRDWRKGLILIAATVDQIRPWIDLPQEALAPISAHWPGAVTWVVPASAGAPDWITGGRKEIAVRITAHPVAAALAAAFGGALVSTSANPAASPPARGPLTVRHYFGQHLDLIMSGEVNHGAQPTPIRHWCTGEWLRR